MPSPSTELQTFADLKSGGSVTCESSAYPHSAPPIQPLNTPLLTSGCAFNAII